MKKYKIYLAPSLNIEMESELPLDEFTIWAMNKAILLHKDAAIITKHIILITPVI
jgi:hypothetical protein